MVRMGDEMNFFPILWGTDEGASHFETYLGEWLEEGPFKSIRVKTVKRYDTIEERDFPYQSDFVSLAHQNTP